MEIKLTGWRGGVCLVDAEDYDLVKDIKWINGGVRVYNVYWVKGEDRRATRAIHQLIMNPPKGMVVDHINGDVLDNRKQNLRICTRRENSRNSRPKSDRKWKGVYFVQGKWVAQIRVDRKLITIGRYLSEREGAEAYNEAAKRYHGEFAWLNDI